MGRPINSKYFSAGARGLEVASVTVTAPGSYTSTAFPAVSFGAPSLPGGTIATGSVSSVVAVAASVVAAGTNVANVANGASFDATYKGYQIGDVLTVAGGAAFTVNALQAVSVVVNSNIADRGTGFHVGDIITLADSTGTGILGGGTPVTVRVTQVGSGIGEIQNVVIQSAGNVTSNQGTGPFNDHSHTGTGGGTRNFTVAWGVAGFAATPANAATYSSLSAAQVSTGVATTGGTGTGATLTFSYGVNQVSVAANGSGYITADDAAITFSGGTGSGAAASSVMIEAGKNRVLVPIAKIVSQDLPADIIKQMTSNSFMMRTAEGMAQCTLVAPSADLSPGQAALLATDSQGNTYCVIKITAHKVTVVREGEGGEGGWDWPTGADVPWTFDAPNGTNVQIFNA